MPPTQEQLAMMFADMMGEAIPGMEYGPRRAPRLSPSPIGISPEGLPVPPGTQPAAPDSFSLPRPESGPLSGMAAMTGRPTSRDDVPAPASEPSSAELMAMLRPAPEGVNADKLALARQNLMDKGRFTVDQETGSFQHVGPTPERKQPTRVQQEAWERYKGRRDAKTQKLAEMAPRRAMEAKMRRGFLPLPLARDAMFMNMARKNPKAFESMIRNQTAMGIAGMRSRDAAADREQRGELAGQELGMRRQGMTDAQSARMKSLELDKERLEIARNTASSDAEVRTITQEINRINAETAKIRAGTAGTADREALGDTPQEKYESWLLARDIAGNPVSEYEDAEMRRRFGLGDGGGAPSSGRPSGSSNVPDAISASRQLGDSFERFAALGKKYGHTGTSNPIASMGAAIGDVLTVPFGGVGSPPDRRANYMAADLLKQLDQGTIRESDMPAIAAALKSQMDPVFAGTVMGRDAGPMFGGKRGEKSIPPTAAVLFLREIMSGRMPQLSAEQRSQIANTEGVKWMSSP